MIDKATVQRIKDTANIVEVVSDYVHLTRRGSNYMGLCPFHNERTPSFSVNPRRNICHCFSCGKGGSPVNFIMEKEGISYYDALKQLAKKYGIKVEERELTPEEKRLATEREGLMIAAEAAMLQMEKNLTTTEEGRNVGLSYLYSRGVTDEAIKAFHLGYAIDKGNHLTGILQRRGFEPDVLKSLGIAGVGQNGNLYDKYRGRVIFPIINSSGKIVGFGGRDLKGGPAKYINSPESVLYHKNNELYGIYQAKNEIVRQGRCFLVEGYLDVISMWQSGMKNVVASSGTALTDGQIAMIHRFAPNITLVYDGDAAGIKAALRGIDMLLSHKLKVSVLLLPDGHDPDSFARTHTPEEFRDYVEKNECDIIRFKIEVLMKGIGDNPQKKAEVVSSVVHSIACIPEGVARTIYIGECARILKIDEATIAAAVERERGKILEQQRFERRRREAASQFPENVDQDSENKLLETQQKSIEAASGDSSDKNIKLEIAQNSDPLVKSINRSLSFRKNPMYPLEKRMIELLIKYGYLKWEMAEVEQSDGNISDSDNLGGKTNDAAEDIFTVVEFVRDELEVDNLSFSDNVFRKIFDIMLANLDDFFFALDEKVDNIEESLKAKRKVGHDSISLRVSTIADIEREEKKLEESLEEERKHEILEFCRFYPGNLLASHEDKDVRNITTEAISEKYVLSNIFTKNSSASSEDNILGMIDRALIEWKSEILNQMMTSTMKELREISIALDEGDFSNLKRVDGSIPDMEESLQRMKELQAKLSSMMAMRSKVAKNIGDRILCPRPN